MKKIKRKGTIAKYFGPVFVIWMMASSIYGTITWLGPAWGSVVSLLMWSVTIFDAVTDVWYANKSTR